MNNTCGHTSRKGQLQTKLAGEEGEGACGSRSAAAGDASQVDGLIGSEHHNRCIGETRRPLDQQRGEHKKIRKTEKRKSDQQTACASMNISMDGGITRKLTPEILFSFA